MPQLFVRDFSGRDRTFDFDASWTVRDLKQAIFERLDIPRHLQRLHGGGFHAWHIDSASLAALPANVRVGSDLRPLWSRACAAPK